MKINRTSKNVARRAATAEKTVKRNECRERMKEQLGGQ